MYKYICATFSVMADTNEAINSKQNNQKKHVFVSLSSKTEKKQLYGPVLWMWFNCLKARTTSRRQFLPLSSQKFLVLILSTSKG